MTALYQHNIVPVGATTLCKDCYFVERTFWGKVKSFAECHHPSAVIDEPKPALVIGGIKEVRPPYAATTRLKSAPCGPEAKLFKPYRDVP